MKTILIATDFSKASRNASLYGLQLAKAMNANIILFAAYGVTHPIAALNVQVSHYDAKMQTEQRLNDEVAAINNKERSPIKIICEEGAAEESILNIANEKGADLIVVGIKGGGKNLKKLFGSTTTSIIKVSNIPVLIIPEEAKFYEPKKILYASDAFLDTTIRAVDQITWITQFFKSKLYALRIVKNKHEEVLEYANVPQKLRAGLRIADTTFQFPVNTDISNGLNEFIRAHQVDMLVMLPHKHEWVEQLFIKSETKEMIFQTRIPLLVLSKTKESELIIDNFRETMYNSN